VAPKSGIYVEIVMRAGVDEIWRHTQTPELHEQWDLRFTKIQYLPRSSATEPQRFQYSTRLGFGLKIDGAGESTGTREDASGSRTSALSFWSADPKSLIEKGSGYWKYDPTSEGVRFLTWYDYETRFGATGRLFDGLIFRPLIGWATAWSFDRLRLWVDCGVRPQTSLRMTLIHGLARLGIAFTWMWQGLIPKLMFPSPDEKVMIAAAGLPRAVLPILGILELLAAACTLWTWRWRPFFLCNALVMIAALLTVAHSSPSYLAAAFNPVTLNVAMILLSAVGRLASVELPSADRCRRMPLTATTT
jgi:hypothetical protein